MQPWGRRALRQLGRELLRLIPVAFGIGTVLFLYASYAESATYTPRLSFASGPCGYPCNPASTAPKPLVPSLSLPLPERWGLFVLNLFTLNWGTAPPFSPAGSQLPDGPAGPLAAGVPATLGPTLELLVLAFLFLYLFIRFIPGPRPAGWDSSPGPRPHLLAAVGSGVPVFLSVLLFFGSLVLLGGMDPTCGGASTGLEFWFQVWSPSGCGLSPGPWVRDGFSFPTHVPSLDAALNGSWILSLDSLRHFLVPAAVLALAAWRGGTVIFRRTVDPAGKGGSSVGLASRRPLDGVRGGNQAPARTIAGVTAILGSVGLIFGLTPVVEWFFYLPGFGSFLATSLVAPSHDPTVLVVVGFLSAVTVWAFQISLRIVLAALDPRPDSSSTTWGRSGSGQI